MRIQRDDQLPGRDAGPDATINSIVRPNHPAQIQIHTLAGAALRRSRKEESDCDPSLQFTSRIKLFVTETQQDSRKVFERSRGVFIGSGQPGCKRGLDRTVILQHPAEDPEQNREIPARVESMVEAPQAANIRAGIELGEGFRRSGPEVTKRAPNRAENALYVSIGECGSYEPHYFAISWILISVDELDRIVPEVLFLRKLIDERVEMVLERHENDKPRIERIYFNPLNSLNSWLIPYFPY
jgi:hypothetical protein